MMPRLPFLGDPEIQAKAKRGHAALIQEGVGQSGVVGRSQGLRGQLHSSPAHPELPTAQGH